VYKPLTPGTPAKFEQAIPSGIFEQASIRPKKENDKISEGLTVSCKKFAIKKFKPTKF
jgi:hypothetical protein